MHCRRSAGWSLPGRATSSWPSDTTPPSPASACESNLYEEPKKLVALGLARAAPDKVGKRPRTLYSITPKGRRALAAWMSTPDWAALENIVAQSDAYLRRAAERRRGSTVPDEATAENR